MAKRVNKKVGVYRRVATAKDVQNAKNDAVTQVWAIFFTVMHDKEGYGKKRLKRVWRHVNELSDSITQGYVKISDLQKTLEEEMGVVLE